jgi:signal transduction histidine kinase
MPPKVVALGMSEQTLIMIAGTLLLVMSIGLLLTDRILVVKQRFAERRQNFVAAVSHELKTPLTAIRMHAEMLD